MQGDKLLSKLLGLNNRAWFRPPEPQRNNNNKSKSVLRGPYKSSFLSRFRKGRHHSGR